MTAANKVLGCSSTTSDTVIRAELQECTHLKQIRYTGKLKWQYRVNNVPEKRLPAIGDRAVWENITQGRAGIRWET